jgi:DUF1680 family protein
MFLRKSSDSSNSNFQLLPIPANPGALGGEGTDDSLHKVVDAASKAAINSGDPGLEATLNEAIKNLAANPEVLHVSELL